MVYKVLVPHKYYLNYEKKTGIIRSISNEKSLHGDASFEVSFDEYKAFSLGQRRAQDHMIGYAKDPITGKTKKSIIQVTDQLYGFRNNTFEWINESPKKNTELTVEWNYKRQSWIFSLSENGITLPDKILKFRNLLESDPIAYSEFDNRILAAGYLATHSTKYHRRFSLGQISIIEVNENFPKLTHGNVNLGVISARYEINLEQLFTQDIGLTSALKKLEVI